VKAITYTSYGPPEVLSLTDAPKPEINDDEVLVRVRATTVNRTDCGVLRAKPFFIRLVYGLRRPRHTILGNEFAGRVEAIGKDVSAFGVNDDVIGYNDAAFGGHAEYISMPESAMIVPMPADLSYEQSAPISEGGHYALKMILSAKVASGQRVLVYGATGAIGSAAVQLLKHEGAVVTAVCRTNKVDLVRSLGADTVIDYMAGDFTRSGLEYDLVIDAVGKSSFGACKRLLKPGGIYCSADLGFLAQNPILALWTARFGNRKVIFPIPGSDKADLAFLTELVKCGEFKPVIDRHYPLEQVAEAFTYVEKGHKTGSVVITVA
jgi:NADPH:quinone reductase-like Zn-dependent oxidoreductase